MWLVSVVSELTESDGAVTTDNGLTEGVEVGVFGVEDVVGVDEVDEVVVEEVELVELVELVLDVDELDEVYGSDQHPRRL